MRPDKLKVFHTLTQHHPKHHGEWDGMTSHVNWEMLQQCDFPLPSDSTLILACGPKEMEDTVKDILNKNGYKEGEMF